MRCVCIKNPKRFDGWREPVIFVVLRVYEFEIDYRFAMRIYSVNHPSGNIGFDEKDFNKSFIIIND